MTVVPLAWISREPPLPVAAAVGEGPVGRRLAAALLGGGGAETTSVSAALGRNVLLVIGDDLPWVDGLHYLGWQGDLLTHTHTTPMVAADLLAARLRRDHGDRLVVLLQHRILVLPRPRRPADPNVLRQIAVAPTARSSPARSSPARASGAS